MVLDAIRCYPVPYHEAAQSLLDGSDDSELSPDEEPVIRTHRYTEKAVRPQYTIRYTPTHINADKQTYIWSSIHIYTPSTNIRTHTQMHACVFMPAYMYTCMYVIQYASMLTCMYTNSHTVLTHVHKHTCVHIGSSRDPSTRPLDW